MRQRELVEFRTPQHPFLGTNNWGGASPLLARNIPKESLEQKYLKLNTIRAGDEIFPAEDDESNYLSCNHLSISKHEPAAPTPSRRSTLGFFLKILPLRKEKAAAQGTNLKKKRWFPRWDPHHRWPQGWC